MATTGEWGGLQIRFDIPEITDAVSAVNGIFDIIIAALDIALTVLNIIKSFVSSILNPVRAIIQELITALQNIVLDFRQAGFYVNGDWYLLDDSTRDQLRGGYQGYQSRMLSRLLSRTDLGRPTFSPSTTVLALFLYVGVDVSFVDNLANFDRFNILNQLMSGFAAFFGFDITGNPLPTPAGLQANFAGGTSRLPVGGAPASSVATFRSALSRTMGRTSTILQWGLSQSPGTNPAVPSPVVPPDGFLIEMSVFPEGLYVGYLSPTPGSTGGVDGNPEGSSMTPSSYTTGLYQEGATGRPLQIFGGKDSVVLDDNVQWAASFDGDTLRPGATPAFFLDNLTSTRFIQTNVFDAPAGDTSGRYYNQRTMYVPHADVLAQALVGGVYSLELTATDLPWQTPFAADGSPDFDHARPATTVYIRVLSCSNKVTSKDSFKWNVVPQSTPTDVQIIPLSTNGIGVADRSQASNILSVSFPSAETDTYIAAINTALAVMILSRSDLMLPSTTVNPNIATLLTEVVEIPDLTGDLTGATVISIQRGESFQPTGLEGFAQNLLPIFGNIQDYFTTSTGSAAFGLDLRAKIGVLSDQIIAQQGNLPQSLLRLRDPSFQRLVNWRWSETSTTGANGLAALDQTILKSLTPAAANGDQLPMYVAKNARSLDGTLTAPSTSLTTAAGLGVIASYRTTEAGFGSEVPGIPTVSEAAPIVIPRGGTGAWYARELFTPEIYRLSAETLGLVVAESTAPSGWISVRPFQSVSPLSGFQDAASLIRNFLESIAAGIQGGEDLILNFISMLEQRVREIQEVIRRIRSYLSIPLSIEIPDALGLALVVNGMDGVVSGLTSAGNRPTDAASAYAGGLVILGGGIPAIITDLFLLLFQ